MALSPPPPAADEEAIEVGAADELEDAAVEEAISAVLEAELGSCASTQVDTSTASMATGVKLNLTILETCFELGRG